MATPGRPHGAHDPVEVGLPVGAGGELGEGDTHGGLQARPAAGLRRLNDQVKVKRATSVPSGRRPTVARVAVAGSPVATVAATASNACAPSSQVKVVSAVAFFPK